MKTDMIKSKRLTMHPATKEEMERMIAVERDEELKSAYQEMLDGCITHPDEWNFYAVWIIENQAGTAVGDFCFKGICANGATEIGYGIYEPYQGQVYATEAVDTAVKWAFSQQGITAVEAEADVNNFASIRVLEKCGFVPTGKVGEEGPRFERKKINCGL